MTDPYAVLGIDRSATTEEIKAAYRKKAKECHPDLHPDDPNAQAKMNEINEAYEMLTNPDKYKNGQSAGSSDYSNSGYGGYGGYGGYYNPFGNRYGYSQSSQEDPNNPYRHYNRRVVFRMPTLWKVIIAIAIIRFIFRMFTMCSMLGDGGGFYM